MRRIDAMQLLMNAMRLRRAAMSLPMSVTSSVETVMTLPTPVMQPPTNGTERGSRPGTHGPLRRVGSPRRIAEMQPLVAPNRHAIAVREQSNDLNPDVTARRRRRTGERGPANALNPDVIARPRRQIAVPERANSRKLRWML